MNTFFTNTDWCMFIGQPFAARIVFTQIQEQQQKTTQHPRGESICRDFPSAHFDGTMVKWSLTAPRRDWRLAAGWGMCSRCRRRCQQVNGQPSVSRRPDHSSSANCTNQAGNVESWPGRTAGEGAAPTSDHVMEHMETTGTIVLFLFFSPLHSWLMDQWSDTFSFRSSICTIRAANRLYLHSLEVVKSKLLVHFVT